MSNSKKVKREFEFIIKVKGSYYSNCSRWDDNDVPRQIKNNIRWLLNNEVAYVDFEAEDGGGDMTNLIRYSFRK